MKNLLKNDFENNRVSVIITEYAGSGTVSLIQKIMDDINEKLFILDSQTIVNSYDIKMAVKEAFDYAKSHSDETPVLLIENFYNATYDSLAKIVDLCKNREIKNDRMPENMRIVIVSLGETAKTVTADFPDLSNENIFLLHEYPILTPKKVENIFTECLAKTEDDPNAIACEGVCHTFAFDKSKIEENDEKINAMLHELPKEFMPETGGGMSFLAACNDKNGDMWTGDHFTMEKLFALGMAAELVNVLLPREMWAALPGGMPYYAVVEKE